ncbi:MAG: nucleotidyl transferase AbiEii/AbiGii toxin family protein, partial [Phycisphaerae bacterium]
VASPADLMAFKVKVILQRVEAKDYRDIAAMLRAGAHLDGALSAARTLFGMAFQPMESLKALTCFDGGDLSTLSPGDREILVAASRNRIRLEPIELMAQQLSI